MAKLTEKELELIRSSISDQTKTPNDVLLATLRAVLSGGMQNVDPELIRVFSDEINARGITSDMLGESRRRRKTMRITETKLRRIIRKVLKESQNPSDYIENMSMGLGYDDAMESAPSSSSLAAAVSDVRNFGGYEDILMAPEEAIQGLIDRSDAIYELAMEATSGEGYDQSPLADEWRGFLIGILAAG